jgi:hypothetical protein
MRIKLKQNNINIDMKPVRVQTPYPATPELAGYPPNLTADQDVSGNGSGLYVLPLSNSWLRSDLVAGLVLTAVLVPVGMGYAEAAGLPAIYGLYATIIPLIAYAIFGPSRILVLGPDSSLAALIAAMIIPLAQAILPAQ